VKSNQDGSLLLSQSGLIKQIIAGLRLTNSPSIKKTPVTEVLSHFSTSPPFDDTYNYRSVLGKLMYLSSNTHCELSFAIHQCASFSINQRKQHGTALKRIGIYLLGTIDKGTIVRLTDELILNCYADADFAGMFTSSDSDDPKSVRSRTGFIILLGTTPIAWVSKLQSETALSTMESEYIALSQALRVLLPLRQLLKEICHLLMFSSNPNS
jgi:hypothetical protein